MTWAARLVLVVLAVAGCDQGSGDNSVTVTEQCPNPTTQHWATHLEICECDDPAKEIVDGQCVGCPTCDELGYQCGAICEGKHECGTCRAGERCQNHQCVACVGGCGDRECGTDACGNSCGTCPAGQSCDEGRCGCAATCDGRVCGSACGQTCGQGCPTTATAGSLGFGSTCSADGRACTSNICCTPNFWCSTANRGALGTSCVCFDSFQSWAGIACY